MTPERQIRRVSETAVARYRLGEHIVSASAVTSYDDRRAAGSVVAHDPAPGGQNRYIVTRDTTSFTTTEERCFLLGPLRGYI
jgi:hypothetical protein